MLVMSKVADSLNVIGSSAESFENGLNIGTILHGNDSELIFLVDPDEESLCSIVVNTSAGWPVSVETARLEESISLPIKC